MNFSEPAEKFLYGPVRNYNAMGWVSDSTTWVFAYSTIGHIPLWRADPSRQAGRPYIMAVYRYQRGGQKRGWNVVKVNHFATRASAKRAAYRAYKAHARKLEREAAKRKAGYIPPKALCHQCEKRRKAKGDYLCQECRYGS